MKARGNVIFRVRMRFDNSLIDGRVCNGVAGKFLIGLDSDDGEEFPRDSQEIAARAAHFKEFAGGSILTDEIQAGLCIQSGEATLLIEINALEIAVGIANPLRGYGRGIRAECKI